MKSHLVRAIGLALVIAAPPILIDAQKSKPMTDPPEVENGCSADGVRCLFGRAGGCRVVCPPGASPVCEGAYCVLGFPRRARCYCQAAGGTT